jgi:hypothetical protein
MTESGPTPEELSERARRLGTDGGSERDVLRLIQDAEAGGDEHMRAVAGQVVRWPTGPSRAPYPGVYDPHTGRPAWHESNVLMEVSVRIDGRRFTSRETHLDPMLLDLQFGGTDTDRFEHFVKYFIERSFGAVATADEESYRYLRGKVFIVKPGDKHDLERCRDSDRDHQDEVWPRCTAGFIIRSAGAVEPNPIGWGTVLSRTSVLGVCPCRCHRNDVYGPSAKLTANLHGIPAFDEDQLNEDEAADD